MHYGKTIIVTLIAALTLASVPQAQAQMVLVQPPPPSPGPSWTSILGTLGAVGGAVAGYNYNGGSSQGANTAIGGVIGGVTGLILGNLIDQNKASVVGFSRGQSIDDLICVRIRSQQQTVVNGVVVPAGDYCYCYYRNTAAQTQKTKSSSKSRSYDSEVGTAISEAYQTNRCNHDNKEYYDRLRGMRFAYENEYCQVFGDDTSDSKEVDAIAICLTEGRSCKKLR